MLRFIPVFAFASLIVFTLGSCAEPQQAYTAFVIYNDSDVDLEVVWFDEAHRPEVLANDGERFQISGYHCMRSCDDLSPGTIDCAPIAPTAAVQAGESTEMVWGGQRLLTENNLYGDSCLRQEALPEETYTARLCVHQITDAGDAAFVCKEQAFELRYENEYDAATKVDVHFAANDLP